MKPQELRAKLNHRQKRVRKKRSKMLPLHLRNRCKKIGSTKTREYPQRWYSTKRRKQTCWKAQCAKGSAADPKRAREKRRKQEADIAGLRDEMGNVGIREWIANFEWNLARDAETTSDSVGRQTDEQHAGVLIPEIIGVETPDCEPRGRR